MVGYKHRLIKNGKGKGIGTYYINGKLEHKEDINTKKFQITKFQHENVDIINVLKWMSWPILLDFWNN